MPHLKISWSFSVLLKTFYVFKQLLRKLMKSSNTSFRSTPLHIYVVKVNYYVKDIYNASVHKHPWKNVYKKEQ